MNVKIMVIDEGHTVSGADYGAVGNGLYESIETRELGKLITKYAKAVGITVDKCTIDYANSVSDSITKRVSLANKRAHDVLVIIHFNSSKNSSANGCEVFILPNANGNYRSTESYNKNKEYGEKILQAVCNAGGFYKRGGGVKFREDLGMLCNTRDYSVYLEVCFLSNKDDVQKYKANKDKIARAIVEAISNKKIEIKPSWKKNNIGWWYDLGDGTYPINKWMKINNEWYWFDEKGYAYEEKWLKYKNKWYWFNKDCKMVQNCVLKINNKYYAFNAAGEMIEGSVKVSGNGDLIL